MLERYPYVSHLIFNAGGATFTGINWPLAVKQVLTEPLEAVTSPAFYLQSQGDVSMDGLGWTWQTNLFSHFVIVRPVLHLSTPDLILCAVPRTGISSRLRLSSSCHMDLIFGSSRRVFLRHGRLSTPQHSTRV